MEVPGVRVKLMLTCLCDAFYGEVGIASVRVLEHAGCKVEFPDGQTCCGQPPFNAGAWDESRPVAKRCAEILGDDAPIVVPSASCAGMLRDGYPMLGLAAPKAFELSEFLVREIGVDKWPLSGSVAAAPRRVAFHRACHGRVLGLGDTQERLLCMVPGIEIVPIEQPEQCCGFGGAFSATHGKLSASIGLEKLRCVLDSGAKTLVSGDMGCLMHLNGLIEREGLDLMTAHYAQILAEAINV